MNRTCGNCFMCEKPHKSLLKRAQIGESKIGFCVDLEEFVCLDDTPVDTKCEEVAEWAQRWGK